MYKWFSKTGILGGREAYRSVTEISQRIHFCQMQFIVFGTWFAALRNPPFSNYLWFNILPNFPFRCYLPFFPQDSCVGGTWCLWQSNLYIYNIFSSNFFFTNQLKILLLFTEHAKKPQVASPFYGLFGTTTIVFTFCNILLLSTAFYFFTDVVNFYVSPPLFFSFSISTFRKP